MSNRHIDRKAVVKLAQEAGLSVQEGNSFADDMYISVLYRFANLVASQDSDRVALSADGCNSAHEALQHELSMIGSAIESFDSTAAALRALIDWHCAVAVDPAVNGGKVLVPVSTLKDAERYAWLKENCGERLTRRSLLNEFSEHKTEYIFPSLIAWADFCGQITLDEAIDFKIEAAKEQSDE